MNKKSNKKVQVVKKKNNTRITNYQIYKVLISQLNFSEQIRWTRFNNFLVVNSILVIAWVTVFSILAGTLEFKSLILSLLCILGIILGVLWAFLGSRSSKYLDKYYEWIIDVEKDKNFINEIKPFTVIDKDIRKTIAESPLKITSSKWLVTWIPIAFSLLFIILLFISWFYCLFLIYLDPICI